MEQETVLSLLRQAGENYLSGEAMSRREAQRRVICHPGGGVEADQPSPGKGLWH